MVNCARLLEQISTMEKLGKSLEVSFCYSYFFSDGGGGGGGGIVGCY